MQISTFENEMEILGFYLLRNLEVKTGKTNKQYIDIILEDKTGQINAKIWNTEGVDPEEFKDVTAVKVKGRVKEFNGTLQINIEKMRPVNKKDGFEIEDLIPSAPVSGEKMIAAIKKYIDQMSHQGLKAMTGYIFDRYKDRLLFYPAAKSNHHSIRSGLLYHITKMLEVSDALCSIYENVDRELLAAGIILHDMAKIDEMNANELGVVSEYSTEGELIGHITMGAVLVDEAGRELGLDQEVVMVMKHMILSHHYEAEYGSPKKPCFIEAELLHYIDMIDARVFDMEKAVRDIGKGTFSDPVLSIDRRKIYKPNI